MKKLLLASAVAALSITAAQAAPTVYGKAFLTLDVQDGNSNSAAKDSRTQLNSNASRIGLKGSEALTQNTDLVYQLEYRVDIDSDAARNWESRDTYLGLANKQYGTLVAGRLTTIDDYVDYANVTAGRPVGGNNVLASFSAERANNAFAYFSPERNGLQFMGMYALDENKSTDNLNGDAFGVGVKYEPANQPFKVGATYIRAANGYVVGGDEYTVAVKTSVLDANGAATGDYIKVNETRTTPVVSGKLEAIRVSGAYAASPVLTLGGLYQNTKRENAETENAFTVSANYKVAQTPWTTYGQLDFVDNTKGKKDAEVFRTVVGGKYVFNKATTGHIYGAYQRSENTNLKTGLTEGKANAYGIGGGIEYKF
ncbi:Class 1 protein [Moraxella ovis]|uniref:Class 1 protein n=1 Tax=Moraxella ovis TaxID=29433 RepID=A0A378PKY2_9GAMM|nr:porin [Moraxella ovis]STY87432.1 Class 1 protein [Moraxella ovis]